MSDTRLWSQMLKSAAVGAFLMAVMLPGLALVRDTSGHDWYAAGKLTLAEAAIASGLDPRKPTQYRTRDGETGTLSRYRMMFVGEALVARSRIVSTALSHAVLGFAAGALLGVLFEILWMKRHAGQGQRDDTRAMEERAPPSGSWQPADVVQGMLRVDGMAQVGVVVVLPAEAGEPAQVYGDAKGRTALPRVQENPVGDAPPVKSARALPAPEVGQAQPGPDRRDGRPENVPARSQPKPATHRGRKQRKPARPTRGKGKLWF